MSEETTSWEDFVEADEAWFADVNPLFQAPQPLQLLVGYPPDVAAEVQDSEPRDYGPLNPLRPAAILLLRFKYHQDLAVYYEDQRRR